MHTSTGHNSLAENDQRTDRCGASPHGPRHRARHRLRRASDQRQLFPREAKNFQRYQLYYAGTRVVGLPQTSVDRFYYPMGKYGPEVDSFSFTYGDCTPPPVTEPYGESPTCALPLQIEVRPACIKPPSYVKYPKGWKPMRGGLGKYWPTGGSLQLWTGRVYVRISPANPRVIPEVVRRLVPLNRVDRQPRDRRLLPAPRLDSAKKTYCRWEARRR